MEKDSLFKSYLVTLLFMLVLGWGGLFYLVTQTQPWVWARWAFFALTVIAVSASAFPFVFLWHRWRGGLLNTSAIMRQSLWMGVYAAFYAWLEMMTSVSFGLAAGLAVLLWLLEAAIGLSERTSRPQPLQKKTHDD